MKQDSGLSPTLFNLALVYVIKKLSVDRNATSEHKMAQIIGYVDNINIMASFKEEQKGPSTNSKVKQKK